MTMSTPRQPTGYDVDDVLQNVPLLWDLSTQQADQRAHDYRLKLADEQDPERRAALLAVLAVTESALGSSAATETLAKAKAAATETGTAGSRAYFALAEYGFDLSPEALDQRRIVAAEALQLLDRPECHAVRATLLPVAFFGYLGALMESGDVREVDVALSPGSHRAELRASLMESRYAIWFRCSRACLDGSLEVAERLALDARSAAAEAGDIDADAVWLGQIAVIRWMQGRISEMEQTFLRVRQVFPDEPVWASAVAWIWAHQGRAAAARGLISSLPKVADWTRGRNFLAGAAILAEVAAEVGSDELVDALYRELLPFADRIVPIGLGVVCWGTVARPLALLEHRRGRPAQAVRWYRRAIDLCSTVGAQAWLAQAQVELAALLLEYADTTAARHDAAPGGDDGASTEEARAMIEEALTAARHLGLRGVEQRADRLLGRSMLRSAPTLRQRTLPAHVAVTDPPIPADSNDVATTAQAAASVSPSTVEAVAAPAVSRMVDGRGRPSIWVLGSFAVTDSSGAPVRWKSRKARTLLKILLARRGALLARESAMDLLWPGEDRHLLKNRLAVAMTTIRAALDPQHEYPPNDFLVADTDAMRLNIHRLSIDAEEFLLLAQSARSAMIDGLSEVEQVTRLREAVEAHTGVAFADEPYEAWAEQMRRQTHLALFGVLHALADLVGRRGDYFEQVELYRRVIATDPYDQAAHDGLITALGELGASAPLAQARAERHRALAELGISATST